jgi:branched-chain amino acid transport system permease protein
MSAEAHTALGAAAPRRRLPGGAAVWAAGLATALAGVAIPSLVSAFWLSACTAAAIYALVAASAGMLYGRLGIVSLYQVALLGIGGWVALRLGTGTGVSFGLLMLAAGVCTAVIAVLTGLPALRFGGLQLALITLMTAGAAEVLFLTVGFPDGGPGFLGIADSSHRPVPMRRPELGATNAAFFRYAVVVVGILFFVYWLQGRSRSGRAWETIREGAEVARASGIDVVRNRLFALALTGFGTGIAGALLAASIHSLLPGSFSAAQSAILFVVVLVGGAYSLLGAVIAGGLAQLLPSLFQELGIDGNLLTVLFGLGLLVTFVAAPRGVAGQLKDLTERIGRRR